jgi:tetratricopeptide (TPR) repeat protein
MKALFLVVVFSIFCSAAFGQQVPVGFDLTNYGVRIEPDKRVIVVLAALEAARTTDASGNPVPVLNPKLSPEGEKFRDLLRSDLAALDQKLRDRITQFVTQHKRRNANKTDGEITAAFISMAYALTPAPDLSDPVVTSDLPGPLLDVLDFAPLVRDFYRSSTIAANLPEYIKTYQRVSDGALRRSSGEMVSELLSYLQTRPQLYIADRVRTETAKSGSKKTKIVTTQPVERERRFFIVPEMLAPAGNVVFLNAKDDYVAVVPPDSDITASEVRRAYLQFVIDPLVLGSSKDVAVIREGVKKLLDEQRAKNPLVSPDVYLTISRSLVAAIDTKQLENLRVKVATEQSRQRIDTKKTDAEKRQVSADLERYKSEQADESILRLSEDYDKGATLVFYFADQLKGVENSGFNIASSLREMLLSFDGTKEMGRYGQFAENRKRALAVREARKANPTETLIVENPVTTRLLEIDKVITAKNYAEAKAELKILLDKNPSDPRIFFSIGRVSSLLAEQINDPEAADKQRELLVESKVAFENVLRIAQAQRTDMALISLTYVALGKIYEFYGDKTYAISIYDAAIKIGNVTGGGHNEALNAKARLIKEQ